MATGTPSPLKMGWMLVLFDLPVTTKRERGRATRFRKNLLDDGYTMLQFSVYMRSCSSWERMQKHAQRLKIYAPEGGNIRAIMMTEKQWVKSIAIVGEDYKRRKKVTELHQLNMFENW
ncbi:MAG: CRISPR-associated endonuclease Cas2 [Thermodesulfobacteriota bacterium]